MVTSSASSRTRTAARRVVAVGSAKGGVGASMIATNLGIFLAQIGKRVVLVDANFSDSAMYSWLGIDRPARSISDVLGAPRASIEASVSETSVTGLYLLSGVSDLAGGEGFEPDCAISLMSQVRNLEADFVIIDLPGGIDTLGLELFTAADFSVLVTLATPDCVEASYRFIAAAWLHALRKKVPDGDSVSSDALEAMRTRPGRFPVPREIVLELTAQESPMAAVAKELSSTFHPQLVVNQTKIKEDEELGDAMVSASTRWLGIVPLLLGSVGWDDNVWLSLRRGRPLLIDFARSRACKDLEQIVRKMLSLEYKDLFLPTRVPPAVEEQDYYEILEIYPGASEEEVRRALKQIRSWFGMGGMAVRGVCSDEEREVFQRLAEEAHAKLVDKSERRQYDRHHFPEGVAASSERSFRERHSIAGTVAATQESLPRVELTGDQFVDGVFLGEIRRMRNVELEDISNRAKISVNYLRAIEEERFADLPAAVFTRGFVTEFARFLKIDHKRAVNDFMAKYEVFLERGKKK